MKLSIIICTRNRAYAIGSCLDAAAAAIVHAGLDHAEIIVVDNASTDTTQSVVQAWAAGRSVGVQLLHEPKKGLSHARNCGMAAAKGDLIVFTDDDCHLDTDYVTQLLAHDAADTGLVLRGGRINLGDPSDLPITIKTEDTRQQWSRALGSARHGNVGDSILGANMAMRRGVITTLGAFDVRFGAGASIPAGEDTDYVLRAYLAGMLIEYVPDMAVSHFHGRKLPEQGKQLMRNYMIGSGALYAKYGLCHVNFLRPVYWDAKAALREIKTRSNSFLPALHFSHRDKIIYNLRGIAQYLWLLVKPA